MKNAPKLMGNESKMTTMKKCCGKLRHLELLQRSSCCGVLQQLKKLIPAIRGSCPYFKFATYSYMQMARLRIPVHILSADRGRFLLEEIAFSSRDYHKETDLGESSIF